MRIKNKMTLISISDAKRRFTLGQQIYVLSKSGLNNKIAKSIDDLVAGNVFIEEQVIFPNELELNGLFVTKNSDGSHKFEIAIDYYVYSTDISPKDAERLVKFLAKSYEQDEE